MFGNMPTFLDFVPQKKFFAGTLLLLIPMEFLDMPHTILEAPDQKTQTTKETILVFFLVMNERI